ncbi:twin-arginine translocase subunit TatB, partial [Mycobacterium sp. ITM-2017-0098]
RQARDYITGATSQLREDLGPEFDDLREPLSELQKLRGMTPRAALTKHLLDGDDSIFTGKVDAQSTGQSTEKPQSNGGPAAVSQDQGPAASAAKPEPSGSTPFDTDAT